MVALLIAGWSYASYSFSIGEKSLQSPFGPIIWPLKMVIPAAAALLLLQGVSQVLKCVRAIQRGSWDQDASGDASA
jgi:TRAP-type mannitol/chloroaromatic compound transport system permease small subunit